MNLKMSKKINEFRNWTKLNFWTKVRLLEQCNIVIIIIAFYFPEKKKYQKFCIPLPWNVLCIWKRKRLDFGYAIISGKFANILLVICSVFLRYTLYDFALKKLICLMAQKTPKSQFSKNCKNIVTHSFKIEQISK